MNEDFSRTFAPVTKEISKNCSLTHIKNCFYQKKFLLCERLFRANVCLETNDHEKQLKKDIHENVSITRNQEHRPLGQ